MPWLPVVAAVVGTGAAIASGVQSANAASDQRAYNAEVQRLQDQYRRDVMHWQNSSYANDVDFYSKQVEWERAEFAKVETRTHEAIEATNEDMFGKVATAMTRKVEQDLATALSRMTVNTQGAEAGGQLETHIADSGVGGNTVNMLRGEVRRQVGTANATFDLQQQANDRQAGQEVLSIKAAHDQQLAAITIPTFQPIAPPKPPSPVSPVNPAAPVAVPSAASIVLSGLSAGINLGSSAASFIKAVR